MSGSFRRRPRREPPARSSSDVSVSWKDIIGDPIDDPADGRYEGQCQPRVDEVARTRAPRRVSLVEPMDGPEDQPCQTQSDPVERAFRSRTVVWCKHDSASFLAWSDVSPR